MVPHDVLNVIAANRQRYVDELLDFLTIPSVSTYSHHSGDLQHAAEWVLDHLKRLGLQARIYETERHPIVYGAYLSAKDRPTLLIYGHYDVQPPEPLDEWLTPPFQSEYPRRFDLRPRCRR